MKNSNPNNFNYKEYYDSLALLDRFGSSFHAAYKSEDLFNFLDPKNNLLDIGMGDGGRSIFCAERKVNVTGIDISLTQLKKPREALFIESALMQFDYLSNQTASIMYYVLKSWNI